MSSIRTIQKYSADEIKKSGAILLRNALKYGDYEGAKYLIEKQKVDPKQVLDKTKIYPDYSDKELCYAQSLTPPLELALRPMHKTSETQQNIEKLFDLLVNAGVDIFDAKVAGNFLYYVIHDGVLICWKKDPSILQQRKNILDKTLAAGFDINDPVYYAKGSHTPLICATSSGARDMTMFLLDRGADLCVAVNTIGKYHTPISIAFEHGHKDLAKELIQYAFKLFQVGQCDFTAALGPSIIVAVGKEDLDLLEFLIRNNANVNAVDSFQDHVDRTALHILVDKIIGFGHARFIGSCSHLINLTQTLLRAGVNTALKSKKYVKNPVCGEKIIEGFTALEIAEHELSKVILDSEKRDLLQKFIKVVRDWDNCMRPRKTKITELLDPILPVPLSAIVQSYAIPDDQIEIKESETRQSEEVLLAPSSGIVSLGMFSTSSSSVSTEEALSFDGRKPGVPYISPMD